MSTCQICRADSAKGLCPDHIEYLRTALSDIRWLWNELQTTITRTDKLNMGVTGQKPKKSSETPSVINWGASRFATELQQILGDLVLKVARKVPANLIGPLEAGWDRLTTGESLGRPPQQAAWLRLHLDVIADHPDARRIYFEIIALTHDPDRPKAAPGRLLAEVNKKEEIFAGPCPQIVGYGNTGEKIHCGEILWAYNGAEEAECRPCRAAGRPCTVDVKTNIQEAWRKQDLVTESALLSMLDDLGEHLPRTRFYDWLKAGRVQTLGYVHDGRINTSKVRDGDPRVFSLSQVRLLRWQHENAKAAS